MPPHLGCTPNPSPSSQRKEIRNRGDSKKEIVKNVGKERCEMRRER